jgi:hypothetical protein
LQEAKVKKMVTTQGNHIRVEPKVFFFKKTLGSTKVFASNGVLQPTTILRNEDLITSKNLSNKPDRF